MTDLNIRNYITRIMMDSGLDLMTVKYSDFVKFNCDGMEISEKDFQDYIDFILY